MSLKYIDPFNKVRDNTNIAEITKVLGQKDIPWLYDNLTEHSAYLVVVCYADSNPMHEAILLTGFKTGGYWELVSNSYEGRTFMREVHAIQIVKQLHVFKKP